MRKTRWLAAGIVAVLLGGAVPAYADDGPDGRTVRDLKQNVYLIDGRGDRNINNLMPGDDVAKIDRLQNGNVLVRPLSPASPDGVVITTRIGDEIGFTRISDGSFRPLRPAAFGPIVPIGLAGLGINNVWRDDKTLAVASVVRTEDGPVLALALINYETGAVDAEPLNFPPDAIGLSLAPGAQSILLVVPPAGSEEEFMTNYGFQKLRAPASEADSWVTQAGRDAIGDNANLQWMLKPARNEAQDKGVLEAAEEPARLELYSVATSETNLLRELAPGDALGAWAWSPIGSRLAIGSFGVFDYRKDPTPRDGRRYDGALIAEEIYRDATGNLPPAQNPFLARNVIDTFDVNSGARKTLRAIDGDGAWLLPFSWAPDEQTLLVGAYDPGRVAGRRLPVYNPQFLERATWRFYNNDLRETGRFTAPQVNDPTEGLFSPAVNAAQMVSPDEVIFNALNATDLSIYYYNRRSGELRKLSQRPGTHVRVEPVVRTRQVVFTYTSVNTPPDMFRVNWDGNALYRLTWANEGLRQFSKADQHAVSFTLRNGQTFSGVLALPAGTPFPPKNVPIVVYQEGGPGGSMINAWAAIVERPYALLPNFGMGVLMVSLSGRYGNGPRVYSALYDNNNFGARDIDEQAEISRQMISRGWTSTSKLGIVGCSYGGYFAMQSIVRHPDLYAAANPQCALVDTISEWTRGFGSLMPYIQGVPPWTDTEEYKRDSPVYNTGRIKTPTLTFHGTNDFLPVTLNENTHLQIVNNGISAKMLQFVGAGHGLGGQGRVSVKYQRYAAQEQILWFRQYLR